VGWNGSAVEARGPRVSGDMTNTASSSPARTLEPDPPMQFFDNAYEGTPTWDIGRQQSAIVRLATAGSIAGPVIEVGCGTGENSLYLASLGYDVVGIDLARRAIDKARAKAEQRAAGGTVEFVVWDALNVAELRRAFQTAIDVGLFHSLQPEQRSRYAAALHEALLPGGRAYLLCWSARNPLGYGPERISKSDIRASFRSGWSIEAIDEETLESRLPAGLIHAWLARLERI
jgi:SAM-dependent methyltransferase